MDAEPFISRHFYGLAFSQIKWLPAAPPGGASNSLQLPWVATGWCQDMHSHLLTLGSINVEMDPARENAPLSAEPAMLDTIALPPALGDCSALHVADLGKQYSMVLLSKQNR